MSNHAISVLAVDDEESFLTVLQNILTEEGFGVVTAADGVERTPGTNIRPLFFGCQDAAR